MKMFTLLAGYMVIWLEGLHGEEVIWYFVGSYGKKVCNMVRIIYGEDVYTVRRFTW